MEYFLTVSSLPSIAIMLHNLAIIVVAGQLSLDLQVLPRILRDTEKNLVWHRLSGLETSFPSRRLARFLAGGGGGLFG